MDFEERLRQEKLEALAQFAAGAGHEINNPLASIIGRAARLLSSDLTPDQRRQVETIGAQAYRIRDMIGDVMLFSRPPQPQLQEIDLWEIVRSAVDRLEHSLRQKKIRLDVNLNGRALISADPVQMAIVVSELLRNAMDAVPPGGRIRVEGTSTHTHGAGHCLKVADNGPGLSAEQRRHCFDPFYSGRAAGRGLGFGLAKCWRIVQQHGGTIELLPSDEETCFRVQLPGGGA